MSNRKPSPADPVSPATAAPALPPALWWRRRWVQVAVAVAVVIIALLVWRVQQSSARGSAAALGPVSVSAALAHQGDFVVFQVAPGTVTPLNTVMVRSRVGGRLTSLAFKEGERVKKGALLATIDPSAFQAQLVQATGKLASDQALLANAQATLKRYQTLLAQDSIARQRVDDQQALARQYAAAVKVDQGNADMAKLQLSYTRITAPISGMAGLRGVDPGNLVEPGDAAGIVRITQMSPTGVVFAIPANVLPAVLHSLDAKRPVAVTLIENGQARPLATGQLTAVDNQIDPATGTVKLSAEFANTGDTLFPNQAVSVRLPIRTLRQATLVPSTAVQQGADGAFVYVVKADDSVTVTPVTVGPSDGTTSVIDRGIAPGAEVVVEGADQLREGTQVAVHRVDQSTAAAGGHAQSSAPRVDRGPGT